MKYLSVVENISSRQHGVVARFQLLNQNCSKSAINRMVSGELLSKIGYGVYRVIGSEPSWKQNAAVAVLSCGSRAFLSHESVLYYLELLSPLTNQFKEIHRTDNTSIHVLGKRQEFHMQNVIYHRSKCILLKDIRRPINGIPQVALTRAFIDSAANLRETDLDYALEKAFQQHLITPHQLQENLNRLPSGPGRKKHKLRDILTPYLTSPGTLQRSESILEKRVMRIIRKHTNFTCVSQFVVRTNNKTYRLDLALPSEKVAIEIDGFRFHSNRVQFDNDRIRQNAICSLGWDIVRITATFSDTQISDAILKSVKGKGKGK